VLQIKIISDGFKTHGIEHFKLENDLVVTSLKLEKNSNTFFGSATDSNYFEIENELDGNKGANKTLENLYEYGMPITSLDNTDNNINNSNNIQSVTGIARERISHVFGGTNLYWHYADSVFFRDNYYRKIIPAESSWYDKPLYYFFQSQNGNAEIALLNKLACVHRPEEYFKNAGVNIAVSGRPILLNGRSLNLYKLLENGLTPAQHFYLEKGDNQHVFKLLRLEYINQEGKEDAFYLGRDALTEKSTAEIRQIREGLTSVTFSYDTDLFDREKIEKGLFERYNDWPYQVGNGVVTFPEGLPKAAYPHNVLGVDFTGNAYLIQFHGKSGLTGPTIEEMQSVLEERDIYSAIVTSNGFDVFLYDLRNSLYYSTSRNLEKVLAQKDRPSQNLMFIYRGE
jgi:hypothetical protein